jgi:YtfJ family uncharacterized protein
MPFIQRLFQLITLLSVFPVFATLPLDTQPPVVKLSGSCGGRVDGTPWSSSEIGGKVYAVYYIAPDKADVNEPLFSALKAENFPHGKVQSVAVINMKATWVPGYVLSMVLKNKQKKYPKTIYVKDNCSSLVTTWNLADRSSDILFFDAQGKVMFSVDGQLTETQIRDAINLIWIAIGGKSANAAK